MRMRRATGAVLAMLLACAVVPTSSGAVDDLPLQQATRLHLPPRTFTMAAVGDFLSENLVNDQARAAAPPGVRYDYEPLLRPVEQIVQSADLAICHMETPMTAPGGTVGFAGTGPGGVHLIAGAYEAAGDLARVGFDRCSTASNHSNDLGTPGIRTTLEALDAAGLGHSGTARSPEEAAVTTFLVKGIRVAHLAYARNSNTGFPKDDWALNKALTPQKVIDDIATARRLGAEVVIVSLHLFVEMQTGPVPDDRALVTAITAAAHPDLIVMHGPHVVQPVERVNGTLVYWSVGNFISGMGVPNRGKYSDLRATDELMAWVRFTQQPDGSWTTEPFTLALCNVAGSRKVYPAYATLADPSISSTLRTQLTQCVQRSGAVVSGLH